MQFKEIILQTASLQRTRLFYSKTLELPLLEETEDAVSFNAGKTKLTFRKVMESKPVYHFAFNIVNNKFSDSYEWIRQKLDILLVEDDMFIAAYNNWNAQSFYFYDNNGNILEFIVRFDLPYYSTEEFSSKFITEISEIGLVVNDVDKIASELTSKHKIPEFQYGPHTHDFVAMGDNYGLILLSTPGRHWVPTSKAAQHFPVTIVGENGVISI
jgi:catechol-2,3-dioxygenase